MVFGWGARGELDGVVFDKAYAVENARYELHRPDLFFADGEAGGVYGSGWAFALFSFGGLFMYGVFRPEFIGS